MSWSPYNSGIPPIDGFLDVLLDLNLRTISPSWRTQARIFLTKLWRVNCVKS